MSDNPSAFGKWLHGLRETIKPLMENHVSISVVFLRIGVLVLSVLVTVLLWLFWGHARQFNHVLSYGAFVIFSFLLTQFWTVAIAYGLMLAVLAASFLTRNLHSPVAMQARLLMMYGLRVASHLEALFAWVLLSLVHLEKLYLRIPVALCLALFGPIVLEGVAAWNANKETGALTGNLFSRNWGTRVAALILTLLGMILLWLSAPEQWQAVLPLFIIVFTAGLVRLGLVYYFSTRYQRVLASGDSPAQLTVFSQGVVWVVVLFVLFFPATCTFQIAGDALEASSRDHLRRLLPSQGPALPAAANSATVSLFIVSDSQFHELRGDRNGGHLQLIDALVPVAVRPVELDLLSGATLTHFAQLYRQLAAQPEYAGMLWTHLGDFADLGCQSEVDRLSSYVQLFEEPTTSGGSTRRLAALLPGNHDSTFVGNFLWHPDWKRACAPSAPMNKLWFDRKLLDLQQAYIDPQRSRSEVLPHWPWKSALPRITRLGTIGDVPIVGVFVDTSDYTGFSIGVAGAQGAISRAQKHWLRSVLASDENRNARIVLFMHHPVNELDVMGHRFIKALATELGSRLLTIVASHTHEVGCRNHLLGEHYVPELIVGSITDPPQEAAILQVSADAPNHFVVRLKTIPAVQRADKQHQALFRVPGVLTGERCRSALSELAHSSRSCQDLFAWHREEDDSLCGRPPKRSELLDSPAEVKWEQQWRARLLLRCISDEKVPYCPLNREQLPGYQLWESVDKTLTRAARSAGSQPVAPTTAAPTPARVSADALVCLSWAASIMQGHKNEHWTLPQTIDFAFEFAVAPLAKQIVVVPGSKSSCEPTPGDDGKPQDLPAGLEPGERSGAPQQR